MEAANTSSSSASSSSEEGDKSRAGQPGFNDVLKGHFMGLGTWSWGDKYVSPQETLCS